MRRRRAQHMRRSHVRPFVAALLVVSVVIAVVAAGTIRALAEPIPAATFQTVGSLPSRVLGAPAAIPWPAAGEAAMVTTSGVSFGTSGPVQEVPIASLTKVMTAYVVLHDHPLTQGQAGPTVTVSAAEAATLPARVAQGQSLVPVTAGEQLSELQALQALLVPSADNIADVLASFDAGSEAAFVAKMNATAAELGMSHTHYADASGLDPAGVSTAADQLVLARKALALAVFAHVVAEPSVTLPVAGTVANYNTLVGHDGFTGIKTGSTSAAGGCLLFSVTRPVSGEKITVIGDVLGQRGGPLIPMAIQRARSMADAAFAAFGRRTVVPAGTTVLDVTQAGRHAVAVTASDLSTIDPAGTPITLTLGPVHLGAGPVATLGLHAPGPAPAAGDSPPGSTTSVRLARPMPRPSLGWRVAHFF
ncbi:MAG: D-alanyl-D-alanine carboxypeptidase family protein [Acidimicrobiales bacterium]